MAVPRGLRALDHPNFRRFYGGQLVSLIGTWMQSVAQAWLVLQITDSPFRLGLISTLQFAPILFFSVVAGAVADRLPKRRLLIATQVALGCQALTLAVLVATGTVEYWHVAVLALFMGFVNTLDLPARQSFIVELVGKADLVSAVALNSAAFNAARVVGPAIAGLLIARVGVAPAFLINGFSFVLVIAALATITVDGVSLRRGATTMLEEIREGVGYALRVRRIRLILGLLLVVSLCVFNFNVFVPLIARDVLRQGAEGFGLLMASIGIGAVLGALMLAAAGGRQSPMPVIFAAAITACAGVLGLAFVRHFWVAATVLFVVGFAAIVTVASCNTTLQLSAPDELRGRVMSLHALVFGGSVPIGAFFTGSISEHWGVGAALTTAGAAGLLAASIIMLRWAFQARRR